MRPAPLLSHLEVRAVISSRHPSLEPISPSQFWTIYDHGGRELYVFTVELGYGQSQLARFNGRTLRQIQSQPILRADNVVIGWIRTWDASGDESGEFSYQCRSSSALYHLMQDWLNIV